jgi:hypothetical protein
MTQSSTPAPAPTGWKVTGQVEQTQITNGGITQGWRVSFITTGGINGSVWVPVNQYNPTVIAAAINPIAAQLDAVAGLTSEG